MFALNIAMKPVGGKTGELKEVLKEWTEYLRSAGDRAGLQETLWAAEGIKFSMTTLYESIAEAGDARTRIYADPEFLSFVGKLVPLVRDHASWSLWDVIVRPPNPVESPKYVLRVRLQSALGKMVQVRQTMTEWCEYSHSKGNQIALSSEVWGARGGLFSVRVPFNSLAEAETSRAENNADPKYQQMASALGGLIDGPASWEMSESIISPVLQEATNGARASARA